MSSAPVIVWFRRDLRVADNPALAAAVASGRPVLPVFVLDLASEGKYAAGGASRWWLHQSLRALDRELRGRGSRLILVEGDTVDVLTRLIKCTQAGAIHWNRCFEPAANKLEERLGKACAGLVEARSFGSSLLFEPGSVLNRKSEPFQVFTPFWRTCLEKLEYSPARDVALPRRWLAPPQWPASLELEALKLTPGHSWASGLAEAWQPGEEGAWKRLRRFSEEALAAYDDGRDIPSKDGTSQLSPHLHFGEITPRQILAILREQSQSSGVFPASRGEQRFLAELGWREFAHHLLYHFPKTPDEALRRKFDAFPWAKDPSGRLAKAWQRGRTGFPIIDAGMRQLWATGWMHNRVRMIVASFWVKQLRLPWQEGAAWFWDTLVDADLANNTLGWQWCAGCGADAAPYFRIFNPVLQGRKFDPGGDYVRKWVPELARLPSKWIHAPWEAPADILRAADLNLGGSYPQPVTDLARARKEALEAFANLGQVDG